MTLTNSLQRFDVADEAETPFGQNQENAIVSMALDHPEFFTSVIRYLRPEMFTRVEAQYVMAEILALHEKYGTVPTRALLYDHITRALTEDDPFEPVLDLIKRKSDPREVPIVKDLLLKWARHRAYGLIYSEDAQDAYYRGDFAHLEEIISAANRINDIGDRGFWFFEQLPMLFEDSAVEHRTTGFPRLDALLNGGGPSPREVVCWLAATNVGKSIMLCNNAITSLKGPNGDGGDGQDVLLVTFELDVVKTALRCLGKLMADVAGDIRMDQFKDHQQYIMRVVKQLEATYKKRLYIHELPPDECSVDHIYALLDKLRRSKGWHPDVVVIDYLELMVSRNPHYNKDDYARQKHVATEVRGLAKNENVLVFTATQTNRSGSQSSSSRQEAGTIDLNQAAESYGKTMPLDYIVSLNQTESERNADPPQVRLYIAKNRNGPKLQQITCTIEYDKMTVREAS